MNPMITVSAGLLDPRHVKAIGTAIWTYLAVLDKQTSPDGTVNRGDPIAAAKLGVRMGLSQDTVLRHLERLQLVGYVHLTRQPYGWIIRVEKPKKLFKKRPGRLADSRVGKSADSERAENPQKCGAESARLPGLYKELIAVKAIIPASEKRAFPNSKTALEPGRCQHSPQCKILPWHVCVVIAEAGELEPNGFPRADLNQAKQLADAADADIRGTVRHMLEVNGDFWGRKKRITPAAVLDHLPLYRKCRQSQANGHAPPMTEAELTRYADQHKARQTA